MPTTKTAPTAAEVRALATQLEAAERSLNARRREARKAAEFAAAYAEFNRADTELTAAYAKADAEWEAATAADPLDLVELFNAFIAMRVASRERAQTIGAANATANALAPRHGGGGGQVDHRRDWHDIFTDVSFIAALDRVVAARVDARGQDALTATNANIRAAGAKAEEEIQ